MTLPACFSSPSPSPSASSVCAQVDSLEQAISAYEEQMACAPLLRSLQVPFQFASHKDESLVGNAAFHGPSQKLFFMTSKIFYLLSASSGYQHWSIKSCIVAKFSARFSTHCDFVERQWSSSSHLAIVVVQFSPKSLAYSMTFLDATNAACIHAFMRHHDDALKTRFQMFDDPSSVLFATTGGGGTGGTQMHTVICAGNLLFGVWTDLRAFSLAASEEKLLDSPASPSVKLRRILRIAPAAPEDDLPPRFRALYLLQSADLQCWIADFWAESVSKVESLGAVQIAFAMVEVQSGLCLFMDENEVVYEHVICKG